MTAIQHEAGANHLHHLGIRLFCQLFGCFAGRKGSRFQRTALNQFPSGQSIIGLLYGSFDLFGWFSAMGTGIIGMGELIIITLMAGGMLELIRFNGGIDYILYRLSKHVNGKRGGEFCIASLVSLANICTANNTIAIITVGPLANQIAERYRIDKRRSASILDIFSCVVQGIIPYGAQMLIAAELTGLSPLSIIGYLYYPMLLGCIALLSIVFRYPRRYA